MEKSVPVLPCPYETERLVLRPFTPADIEAVHGYHSLETVARYQMWERRTRDQVTAELEKWISQSPEGQSISHAVTLKETGALIGDMVLLFRDKAARQGEIGFSFNPAYQGQGYAIEAATAVLGIGFGHYKLHRIFGRCDARNAPSWRLMQRFGMRQEAHFREHAIFKGDWDEEFHYAMLSREWTDMRQGTS